MRSSAKHYSSVVKDIYALFDTEKLEFPEEAILEFGHKLARHISNRFSEERVSSGLRASNIGVDCNRQLWYRINMPEKAEKLTAKVKFKFLYGDIIEELVLFLAKQSGHKVEGQQDLLTLNGVSGHRDAILDGLPIDVKSASTRTMQKFKEHLQEDSFGYRKQLGFYEETSAPDPLVTEKGSGFLVVDKTTGDLFFDHYNDLRDANIPQLVEEKKQAVSSRIPPDRFYFPEPEGKSGNLKLGANCSYCPFKKECWPGLRTFLYSNKPVFLTRVEREPKVPEFTGPDLGDLEDA